MSVDLRDHMGPYEYALLAKVAATVAASVAEGHPGRYYNHVEECAYEQLVEGLQDVDSFEGWADDGELTRAADLEREGRWAA
jgi:hypothetical protein